MTGIYPIKRTPFGSTRRGNPGFSGEADFFKKYSDTDCFQIQPKIPMKKPEYPSEEYKLLKTLEPFLNYRKSATYPIGIGDDAAVRKNKPDERLIITADCLVENVHFSLAYMTFRQIGYKAMAINLSDCAAMAALPDAALVQIIFPQYQDKKTLTNNLKNIYRGFHDACGKWNFPIIGGNLSRGPCWIIDVTLIGNTDIHDRIMLRTGIKNKDNLWTTGHPGSGAAGLAALKKWGNAESVPKKYKNLVDCHIRPKPRIEMGRLLGRNPQVHALIDISDGISKESHTLAFENEIGIILDPGSAAISVAMKDLACELNVDWREWFFHGGEDYELLFAASAQFDQPVRRVPVTRIGVCSSAVKSVYFIHDNGIMKQVAQNGWDHVKNPVP
jgi:thiamine-monophosphate kinase